MQAVADLLSLAEHLESVQEPWAVSMQARLERLLDGEEPAKALGLRSARGRRRWRTVTALERRNAILREVAAKFYPGKRESRQADEIARELRRYAASAWRWDRDKADCPYPDDSLKSYLWLILSEIDNALSDQRIRKILVTS
jgi:hypothetical protein